LKHEYRSKALALLVTLLVYPLSNASLISNVILAIIMSLFDLDQTKELEINNLL